MNKAVIVIGSFALLGVGAYFYFKSKKTPTDATGTGLAPTSSTPQASNPLLTSQQLADIKSNVIEQNTGAVIPTGTVLTTPEQVVQVVQLANVTNNEAQGLASQIITLRGNLYVPNWMTSSSSQMANILKSAQVNSQIYNLQERLKALGYREENGIAIKN